jgi:hypothetical protein
MFDSASRLHMIKSSSAHTHQAAEKERLEHSTTCATQGALSLCACSRHCLHTSNCTTFPVVVVSLYYNMRAASFQLSRRTGVDSEKHPSLMIRRPIDSETVLMNNCIASKV